MVVNLKNFFKDKNVLITGHTGFKGSWLLLILLRLKANVWGFSLKAETAPNLFRSLNSEKLKKKTIMNFIVKSFKEWILFFPFTSILTILLN